MTTLFLYTIKSAIVLTLLYIPFIFMLRREKMIHFNRLTLVGILLLSLILPLCNVTSLSLDNHPMVHYAQQQLIDAGIPIKQIVVTAKASQQARLQLNLFDALSIIYLIGMGLILVIRVIQFCRMGLIIRSGSLWKQTEDGINIYCHADKVAPYSWLHNIVINQEDYESNGREIILHEKGHIRYHHSLDILLLTLVEMLQWWNPICYMFNISLRDIHEFEADDYVLRQGISAHGYQMLLIKKAVGTSSYTFANNFNHSLIINRIAMMQKSNSNPWRRSKVLYVLPVAFLSLSAFATPEFIKPIEHVVSEISNKDTQKASDVQVTVEEYSETPSISAVSQQDILDKCEKLPRFGNGDEDLYKFLASNLRYPAIAMECGVAGRVMVQFVVETDGGVSNMKILKGISKVGDVRNVAGENPDVVVTSYKKKEGDKQYLSEAEFNTSKKALEAEALRVLKESSGKWTPGEDKGKKVRVRFTLPITFRLQ